MLGIGLTILGVAVAVHAAGITTGYSYDRVGPRMVPYGVAAGFAICGVWILVEAISSPAPESKKEHYDWLPIVLISAALIVQMYFINTVGWIPMAMLTFALAARAFGSSRILLNLMIGAALGGATFLLFNNALGLRLPSGVLVRLLSGA